MSRTPLTTPVSRGGLWLASALFLALGAVLLWRCFDDFGDLGGKDWNSFMGQAQAELTSLVDHHQFPLWNPWRKGGQVSFAQPESMLLSPVTPLMLAFGVIAAFKLILLPLFLFGCFGMWKLAGTLGLNGAARLAPALAFFASAVFPLYLVAGLPNWLFGICLLPWLLHECRLGVEEPRALLKAGLCYAVLIFCGSVYQFVFFPIVLGLDALPRSIARRSLRPLLSTGAALMIGVALAAVRLIPMYDVFRVFPREMQGLVRYLEPDLIRKAFLDPVQPDLFSLGGSVFFDGDNWVSWVTVGCYVGPVIVALAFAGALFGGLRALPFVAIAVAFAWLSLGSGTAFSLWDALHHLPLFKSMQAPERLLMPAAFAVCVLAGLGLDSIARWIRTRARLARAAPFVAAALLLCAVVPPVIANRHIAEAAFIVPRSPTRAAPGPFRQVQQEKRVSQWGGELFEAVLANQGNPLGHSDVPSRQAVKAVGDPEYRGEVYLVEDHGRVTSAQITPNEIRVRARLDAADVLVVNQNYFPGWVASGTREGPLSPRQYLLSLPLPAGEHDLVLRFTQPSVARGLWISGLALLLWVVYARRRGRNGPPAPFGRLEKFTSLGYGGLVALMPLCSSVDVDDGSAMPVDQRFGGAYVVDASDGSQRRSGFSNIQAAIDAAAQGELIYVFPGDYGGFKVKKGVSVVADPPGHARIFGAIEISEIPKDARARISGFVGAQGELPIVVRDSPGSIALQAVDTGGAPLGVRGCAQVFLAACVLGSLKVDHSEVWASRCTIGGGDVAAGPRGDPLPGVDLVEAKLRLNESSVRGVRGAGVRAKRSHLEAAGRGEIQGSSSGRIGPPLHLTEGSLAMVSGVPFDERMSVADASSTIQHVDPMPRIALSAPLISGQPLAVELRGPAGAKGYLLLSPSNDMAADKTGHLGMQADVKKGAFTIPVELGEDGTLRVQRDILSQQLGVGHAIFAQLALERAGGKGYRMSPLEFALVEPEGEGR